VDVAGAGDALMAAASLCYACGGDVMHSSAIGAVAATISVQSLGNTPVKYQQISEYFQREIF
jgi:bifunctional ADP-heptose synthase (sugar kinase/adenylyltransferase)